MLEIKKVGIGSAFKIGAVLSVLLWAVFGLFLLLISSQEVMIFQNGQMQQQQIGGGQLFFTYLCGLPVQAVIGGIGGAIVAFFYNLAAGLVGGIEVETDFSTIVQQNYMKPNTGLTGRLAESSRQTPTASTQESINQARKLIQTEQYGLAYSVLKKIPENPTARQWMKKLEEIDPELPFREDDKGRDGWSPIQYD
jgi:hypothetical protein